MISENADRYENVIIRNDKEIGINTFGLDYLVSLEKEIDKLTAESTEWESKYYQQQERNNKAIELIEKDRKKYDYEKYGLMKQAFYCNKTNKLLDILRGDKE